jgi:hypothetical protein
LYLSYTHIAQLSPERRKAVTLSFSFYVVVKFSLSLQLAVDLFVLYSQSFIICEVKTFSKEQLIWYL